MPLASSPYDHIDLPAPCWLVISALCLFGGAYLMAFPQRIARMRLRKKYGENWHSYVDLTRMRILGCFGVGALAFAVGIAGVAMSWSLLHGVE